MCLTVTLRLRLDDFTRATRGHTLPQPTAETDAVLARAENSVRAGESRDARCPRTAGSSLCCSTGMPRRGVRHGMMTGCAVATGLSDGDEHVRGPASSS